MPVTAVYVWTVLIVCCIACSAHAYWFKLYELHLEYKTCHLQRFGITSCIQNTWSRQRLKQLYMWLRNNTNQTNEKQDFFFFAGQCYSIRSGSTTVLGIAMGEFANYIPFPCMMFYSIRFLKVPLQIPGKTQWDIISDVILFGNLGTFFFLKGLL